jgi:hypothetical protein
MWAGYAGVGQPQAASAAWAQPMTGRRVGQSPQAAPSPWLGGGWAWPSSPSQPQPSPKFFWKRFLPPLGCSAGLAPPRQKASISICSSELVLSLGTLHLLLGPLSKFSLNVGALDTTAGRTWSLYVWDILTLLTQSLSHAFAHTTAMNWEVNDQFKEL